MSPVHGQTKQENSHIFVRSQQPMGIGHGRFLGGIDFISIPTWEKKDHLRRIKVSFSNQPSTSPWFTVDTRFLSKTHRESDGISTATNETLLDNQRCNSSGQTARYEEYCANLCMLKDWFVHEVYLKWPRKPNISKFIDVLTLMQSSF